VLKKGDVYNSFSFNTLPGGSRNNGGGFNFTIYSAFFWSAA